MALALKDVYQDLQIHYRGYDGIMAGLHAFERIFPRDKYLVDQLDPDRESIRQGLKFGAKRQGRRFDRYTGEIPGAIPHEIDLVTGIGIELSRSPGYNTLFNAHDTPAHWLNNLNLYQRLYGDKSLAVILRDNVIRAADYIHLHTQGDDALFTVDPGLCFAKRFALNVTYWKDSVVPGRKDGLFRYPATITLLHAQNIAGLESASYVLDTLPDEYQNEVTKEASIRAKTKAEQMGEGLVTKLYDQDLNTSLIAIDRMGKIRGVSSDSLHALYYLRPGLLPREQLRGILESSAKLETIAGYVCLDPDMAPAMTNLYHVTNVWPFEQAFINAGARVHLADAIASGMREEVSLLRHVVEVSSRVVNYLGNGNPEVLDATKGFRGGGGNPQAWTVAAREYFKVAASLETTQVPYPIPASFSKPQRIAA